MVLISICLLPLLQGSAGAVTGEEWQGDEEEEEEDKEEEEQQVEEATRWGG